MSDKHVKRQRQRPHNSAAAGFVAIPPELDAAAGSASPLVAQLGRVAAVGAAQEQVRELKVLATALQDKDDEVARLAALVVGADALDDRVAVREQTARAHGSILLSRQCCAAACCCVAAAAAASRHG